MREAITIWNYTCDCCPCTDRRIMYAVVEKRGVKTISKCLTDSEVHTCYNCLVKYVLIPGERKMKDDSKKPV